MKNITLDCSRLHSYISNDELNQVLTENKALIQEILKPVKENSNDLGWVNIDGIANHELLADIKEKAKEIREKADVFLLIGVGGSNQGARALIEALGDSKVEILYTGNNLSPNYLHKIMAKLDGKSIYANVIAKNFATLEPGIVFRVIRNYMEKRYGEEEAGKRIIATGSLNNSSLEMLGRKKGYTLLPFPLDVGGRYSVLSAVGLLPIAVAGIDIDELLQGAKAIKNRIHTQEITKNDAVVYGVIRNILLSKGYHIEILAHFEPLFTYFSKWWVQLFGESEGKAGKGIYPTACSFSEDLHSLGQYIQQGQRILFETFLNLEDQGSQYIVPHEESDDDGFKYIDSKDFAYLNKTAYDATVQAHSSGGVPCVVLNVPQLTPYYFGQLFYFFEYACYISGSVLRINPFDQPGVEAYKEKMFAQLKTKK
ncbi:phosphoglucose isomerase (pgi) [Lucifera butyrica]|uniref:Glucose-6-phosphate isomerase n=1 Tax=Lucifera butyrica TaxID=1351585 RepID=A0A498R4W4_9FIRM|nr:glucose-6-phosphate isomerase [Lucifera butyrica]VBB07736.1 phosphoglucose isomerase (pgi) [Lucifera butyrica]